MVDVVVVEVAVVEDLVVVGDLDRFVTEIGLPDGVGVASGTDSDVDVGIGVGVGVNGVPRV